MGGKLGRDGEASLVICVKIYTLKLQQEIPKAFHNKLVLTFKGNYSKIQACSWINIYNITSDTKLCYIVVLENTLHIAKIFEEVGSGGREALLGKGHIAADGHFVTFN